MTCHSIETLLLDYANGALSAADRAMAQSHLAECTECRARAEGFRAVAQSLDEWDTPPLSPWFDARLRARIAAEESLQWNWASVAALLRRPVTAAAFAVMLVFGSLTLWISRPVAAPVEPVKVVKATPSQVDELMPVVQDFDMLADFDVITDLKDHKKI